MPIVSKCECRHECNQQADEHSNPENEILCSQCRHRWLYWEFGPEAFTHGPKSIEETEV